MKIEELYLPEDKDLIQEFESIGPMSTGIALSEQERKISGLQIQAILRSKKTMVELDKSNMRFSKILLVFAFIQFIVAAFQLILQLVDTSDKIFGIVLSVVFFLTMYFIIKHMDKFVEVDK